MTYRNDVRRVGLRALYSCEEQCGRTRTDPGDFKSRAASRCSLVDFDPEAWDPNAYPVVAAEAEEKFQEIQDLILAGRLSLDIDLDLDGCPWGWALSPFAESVAAYTGRRDEHSPARSQNLRLLRRVLRDEDEPTGLLEAVEVAESYEDGVFRQFRAMKGE